MEQYLLSIEIANKEYRLGKRGVHIQLNEKF
jgi:hypothetical protein